MAWQPFEKQGENDYDVIVIGAGIAGVNFGYRLQERTPHLKYCILEGRHEMGGTWSLFNYPGIRSDSDLYTFGFAWRPWQAKTAIAEGAAIKQYMKESAAEYGIDKKIKYHHMVNTADWSTPNKTWTLGVTVNENKQATFRARWVLLCTGYYDYHEPLETTIPGIKNFKGQVLHPQFWPKDLDYANKDVVVIGSGATAITVLPIMAQKASHVTMLQRSPSYVMAIPREDKMEKFIRFCFWWAPPVRDFLLRWKWILVPFLAVWHATRFPASAKRLYGRLADRQLPASVPRDPHFTPKYNPWQQRLCICPDGDFYASLRSGKAGIETDVIETITADAIKLKSGKELHPDMIVTATGLKVKFAGGLNVKVDGKPYTIPDKFAWKGVMLEGLPNVAFVIGYVDASWTLGADATAQLVTRLFNTMKKEKAIEVVPFMDEKERQTVKEVNMFRLNSTYVNKALHMMPKTGDRGQWVPRSNFMSDIYQAWYGDLRAGTQWIR